MMADPKSDPNSRSAFAQIFGSGTPTKESSTPKTARSHSNENRNGKAAKKDQSPPPPKRAAEEEEAAPVAQKTSSTPKREVERIDAVRDLLFGDQIAELKDSLEAIERRFATRLTKLEDDTRSQIDNSERRMREQMEGLTQDLRKESEARGDLSSEVVRKLDASTLDLTTRINNLGDELRKRLERETDDIRDSFSERSALSAMFADLSKRLDAPSKDKA